MHVICSQIREFRRSHLSHTPAVCTSQTPSEQEARKKEDVLLSAIDDAFPPGSWFSGTPSGALTCQRWGMYGKCCTPHGSKGAWHRNYTCGEATVRTTASTHTPSIPNFRCSQPVDLPDIKPGLLYETLCADGRTYVMHMQEAVTLAPPCL